MPHPKSGEVSLNAEPLVHIDMLGVLDVVPLHQPSDRCVESLCDKRQSANTFVHVKGLNGVVDLITDLRHSGGRCLLRLRTRRGSGSDLWRHSASSSGNTDRLNRCHTEKG